MTTPTKVTRLRITAEVALRQIRAAAAVSANVILGTHAKERMAERDISKRDVYRVLLQGDLDGAPELTERGEWKCKLTHQLRGRRVAGVVTVILLDGRLFIKTVEWEDVA
jgi:hypothetical protein